MEKSTKSKRLYVLIFLVMTVYSLAQTGVQVQFYSGNPQNYAVETTGKLYFSGDNLLIKTSSSANDVTIPISIIQKVIFTNAALATSEIGVNASQLVLYPNPSSDFIKIKTPKKEKLSVQIFSISGQLVLKGNYNSEENIDVSRLSTGVYLVQANGTTIKFIKK